MSSRADHARTLDAPQKAPRTRRAHEIARVMLVPVAATLLGLLPWLALPHLDGHDRALVWIAGSDTAIREAAARVASEAAFSGAAMAAPAAAKRVPADAPAAAMAAPDSPAAAAASSAEVPAGCPAHATRLHFDIARVDQAQVARAALERIAVDAGAVVCASNRFELNREDAASAVWLPLALSLILPVGLLVAVRAAAPSPETPARVDPRSGIPPPSHLVVVALGCAGLVATCVLPLPGVTAADSTGPLLLAMALGPPAIHEAAYRAWMIPRLATLVGHSHAVGASFAASVVAALPYSDFAAIATAACASAFACGVFLRTASLPACIGAHLLVAAIARALFFLPA